MPFPLLIKQHRKCHPASAILLGHVTEVRYSTPVRQHPLPIPLHEYLPGELPHTAPPKWVANACPVSRTYHFFALRVTHHGNVTGKQQISPTTETGLSAESARPKLNTRATTRQFRALFPQQHDFYSWRASHSAVAAPPIPPPTIIAPSRVSVILLFRPYLLIFPAAAMQTPVATVQASLKRLASE